jgi:hypothetical protein
MISRYVVPGVERLVLVHGSVRNGDFAWRSQEVLGAHFELVVLNRPRFPPNPFERASALGFIAPHPMLDEAFMVKRLPGYSPDLAGRIVYPAAFDALGTSDRSTESGITATP